MSTLNKPKWYITLSAVAGALLPLSMAPFHWWPIAFLSLALFWIGVNRGHKLYSTLAYGAGMYAVGIHWVYVSMATFSGINPVVSTLLLACLVAVLVILFFGPIGWAFNRLNKWRLSPFTFALIFTIGESTRNWLMTGFPWLMVGYSQTDTWLNGYAPIGGVLLVSFVVVFISATIADLWISRTREHSQWIGGVCAALLLTLSPVFAKIEYTEKSKPLNVLLVQPNVAQEHKWDRNRLQGYKRDLVKLTVPHLESIDLAIWPEAAVPELQMYAAPYLNRVEQLALNSNTQIITGMPMYIDRVFYNGAIGLGGAPWEYRKTRLVPFGEYIPFESVTGKLFKLLELPNESQGSGEPNQPPFNVDGVPVALDICYEVAYNGIIARQARHADMLATISNDGWFGRSIGPLQHLQMAQMRAIENRKPMLRSTNNGVSAIIDAHGNIVATEESFKKTTVKATIESRQGLTPYTLIGNWPVVAIAAMLLAIALIRPRRALVTEQPN